MSPQPPPLPRKLHALLIEDEPAQAELLTRWLQADGIQVTVAYDGVTGAQLAQDDDYDVVLTDMNLPCASGLEVVRAAKAAHPHRPAVLMTAHDTPVYLRSAFKSLADDLLLKPLRRTDLAGSLREAVADAETPKHARTVLAIGAHPDDVEIGCGGTLLKHRRAGDRVVVLTVSSGAKGGDADERQAESEHAAHMLGAELLMGDLEDTKIDPGAATIALIAEVIRDVKPDVVYTHSAHETHQDHRAVHAATLVAARGVPNLFCYQSPSTTPDFQPARYVDVGGEMKGKLALLQAFVSQTTVRPYLEEELVRATARYWGRFAGYREVEPLEVVRFTE